MRRLASGHPTALSLTPHDPPRLAASAGTRIIMTGLEASDDSLWQVPRALAGRHAVPGRARLGQSGQWCDVQLSLPTETSLHAIPLVAPLPSAAAAAGLLASYPGALGIGGDDAAPIFLDPGSASDITIFGPPGLERDAVAKYVMEITGRASAKSGIGVRDDLATYPGAPRVTGTILLVRPTTRGVRDACGRLAIGMVDDPPVPGRVVMVVDTAVTAVQLPISRAANPR
jgi:hypothetical protein